jgi:hypothetical protein
MMSDVMMQLYLRQSLSRSAVPNLFINRANIGDKKSWRAYFALENKNMSEIALFKT